MIDGAGEPRKSRGYTPSGFPAVVENDLDLAYRRVVGGSSLPARPGSKFQRLPIVAQRGERRRGLGEDRTSTREATLPLRLVS